MEMIDTLRKIPIFSNLQDEDFAQLATMTHQLTLSAHATLMEEGDITREFYYIVSGEVEILKRSETDELHRIRTLQAGDLLGELAFLEEGARSATIRTLEPTTLLRIDGKSIKKNPQYLTLYAHLAEAMGKALSERLRYTNTVTVKAMQAEVNSLKSQVGLGRVLISIVVLMSLYTLSLGILTQLISFLPSTTPISVGLIVLFSSVLVYVIVNSGYPLRYYGLTLQNWPTQVKEAILYTLPLLGIVVLAKLIMIYAVPGYHDAPLFQPFATILGHPANPVLDYEIILVAYSLFCPVQEFIARGALQGSFQLFLKHKVWISILLSNLLFASSHIHTSFAFAMMAFCPGLFWGWLYNKQRSLVGVSISHIMLGDWVVFVVGFPGLI